MLRDVLTEAELKALLGDSEPSLSAAPAAHYDLDADDRKLLHALVRNQLRLLHMIEEMQAELRILKAAAARGDEDGRASVPEGTAFRQTAASLEPLPFLTKTGAPAAAAKDDPPDPPVSELSRKERFKRKTLKSFW